MPFAANVDMARTADLSQCDSIDEMDYEDHHRTRTWVRRIFGIGNLGFWGAVILSTIGGLDYQNAVDSGAHANLVSQLWCVPIYLYGDM